MVMNRLAVALLIIAQTAKNPTPIIVAALSSKVHNPLTLTPQRLRMSSAAISQTIPFITRVKPSSDFSDSESRCSRPRMDPAMSRVIKETVMKAATKTRHGRKHHYQADVAFRKPIHSAIHHPSPFSPAMLPLPHALRRRRSVQLI